MSAEILFYNYLESDKDKQTQVLNLLGENLYRNARYEDSKKYFMLAAKNNPELDSEAILNTLPNINNSNNWLWNYECFITVYLLGVIQVFLAIHMPRARLLFLMIYFTFLYELYKSLRNYLIYINISEILSMNKPNSAAQYTIINDRDSYSESDPGEKDSEHQDSEHQDSEHQDSEHQDSEHQDSEHQDSEDRDSEDQDSDSYDDSDEHDSDSNTSGREHSCTECDKYSEDPNSEDPNSEEQKKDTDDTGPDMDHNNIVATEMFNQSNNIALLDDIHTSELLSNILDDFTILDEIKSADYN
jgi:hypothetical protein